MNLLLCIYFCGMNFLEYLKSLLYTGDNYKADEFPWDQCMTEMMGDPNNYDEDTASKTCAAIKNRTLKSVIDQKLAINEQEEITVFINSSGGLVETGFAIYEYLTSLKIPITTIISGKCASMATIIALIGTKRQVVKGSE